MYILAQGGYACATVASAADAAGMAPSAIHHYFRDKREILTSLIDELSGRVTTRVEAELAHEPDALRACVAASRCAA